MEQRTRSLCLRNFTKACNRHETFLSKLELSSLDENQVFFDDVVSTWTLVQAKQEEYLLGRSEETYENEISWIDEHEAKFHELRTKNCQYERKVKNENTIKEQTLLNENAQKLAEVEQARQQQQSLERLRKLEDNYKFEMKRLKNIFQSFECLETVSERTLKNVRYDFENQFKEVRSIINSIRTQTEETGSFESEHLEMTELSNKFYKLVYEASNTKVMHAVDGGGDITDSKKLLTHMEKMKFPKFSGNCRDWPQFKKDFEKQVSNVITDDSTVSYALRNALPDHIKSLVRNLSDDIKEMWQRLDERFSDAGKIVEIVLNDIKFFKPVKEHEEKRLLSFIDIIEKASLELKYLGREAEIKNSTIISIIEEKLPDDLRRKWIERI